VREKNLPCRQWNEILNGPLQVLVLASPACGCRPWSTRNRLETPLHVIVCKELAVSCGFVLLQEQLKAQKISNAVLRNIRLD
jgi:hypothetical protein